MTNKNFLTDPKTLMIAGPCSAESRDQLFMTSKAINELGINNIRAGVWKPRSRPDTFEGAGEEALQWISEIKKELHVRFITEVATPQHVDIVLKHEVDMVWIGARTTVNPFLVQEIANALEGSSIPVFIKNPINPELALWIGAIERVKKKGIKEVYAVHRGFSSFQSSRYRNAPTWQIPIELKSKMPDLPLICDPSHIAGNRSMIREICQKALDLNYDGLMIETHIDPDHALSDPKQQVTPEQLGELLQNLKIREEFSENKVFINQLEELRNKIDELDREVLEALAARMRIVEQIGDYKKENNVTVLQVERWKEIWKSRPEWGKLLQIDPQFIQDLYKLVHDESIRLQTEIMNRSTADLDP